MFDQDLIDLLIFGVCGANRPRITGDLLVRAEEAGLIKIKDNDFWKMVLTEKGEKLGIKLAKERGLYLFGQHKFFDNGKTTVLFNWDHCASGYDLLVSGHLTKLWCDEPVTNGFDLTESDLPANCQDLFDMYGEILCQV